MRVRKNPMIPLTAVAAGLLAGAVGTVCLDAVHYLKYRRAGGIDSPVAWEFAPVENWEVAPDPGQVAKPIWEYDAKTLAWDLGAPCGSAIRRCGC